MAEAMEARERGADRLPQPWRGALSFPSNPPADSAPHDLQIAAGRLENFLRPSDETAGQMSLEAAPPPVEGGDAGNPATRTSLLQRRFGAEMTTVVQATSRVVDAPFSERPTMTPLKAAVTTGSTSSAALGSASTSSDVADWTVTSEPEVSGGTTTHGASPTGWGWTFCRRRGGRCCPWPRPLSNPHSQAAPLRGLLSEWEETISQTPPLSSSAVYGRELLRMEEGEAVAAMAGGEASVIACAISAMPTQEQKVALFRLAHMAGMSVRLPEELLRSGEDRWEPDPADIWVKKKNEESGCKSGGGKKAEDDPVSSALPHAGHFQTESETRTTQNGTHGFETGALSRASSSGEQGAP
jgi:hypothetical protein